MNSDKQSLAICVVGDFKYLYKNFKRLLNQLENKGNYYGDIIILTTIWCPTILIRSIHKKSNIYVYRFKKIKFDLKTSKTLSNLSIGSNRHKNKNFQWHKLYLFNSKLKEWDYIFYLDINMHIHFDINDILKNKPLNKIYARADGYPEYKWKLSSQFDKNHKLFKELNNRFDLDITNYFQTGVLFFDTSIIKKNTLSELIKLVHKYPISITNEQGILNLYFIFIKNQYEELQKTINGMIPYFYWLVDNKKVIISKSTTTYNK